MAFELSNKTDWLCDKAWATIKNRIKGAVLTAIFCGFIFLEIDLLEVREKNNQLLIVMPEIFLTTSAAFPQ
ncbi:MAG: hypothetical protein KDC53_10020, partial [Saprospiraceae bacterium]|nr:hypothetical protein [Saprospiraceae bacterium]